MFCVNEFTLYFVESSFCFVFHFANCTKLETRTPKPCYFRFVIFKTVIQTSANVKIKH